MFGVNTGVSKSVEHSHIWIRRLILSPPSPACRKHTCSHATADGPNHHSLGARGFSGENIEFSEVRLGFVDLLVCKKMAHGLVGGGIKPETGVS